MKMQPLPIDPFIDAIVAAVRTSRAAIVTAAPGAGKTTRVPPALLEDGPVLLLQPRRVAARTIAARIAEERGWTIGGEIGWQIRAERRFGPATRLLVATEGILTARLQHDPLLSDFRTIVLDEFHERSVHADLALALARQAWRARDDLRIVIMSATIESAAVAAFLDDCPVVDVPGRMFPIDIGYEPEQTVADAVGDLLNASTGDILCFLPGAFEIRRAMSEIEQRVRGRDVAVVALHGTLDARDQDAALRPSSRRRGDRGDEYRGNVGDRTRRDRGGRCRPAQSRALRRRSRRGQSRSGAHHAGRGGSASRAGRSSGARHGAQTLGRARSTAAASRAGDSPRRSVRRRARRDRVGRRSAALRVVRRSPRRCARRGADGCWSGCNSSPMARSRRWASRRSACPCILASREC